MNKDGFEDKLRTGVDKFVKSSKKIISKAGSAVQDFSDKSVIRIEKYQLETKRDKKYCLLGKKAADVFFNNTSASFTTDEDGVLLLIEEIKHLNEEINYREQQLLDSGENQDK